MNAEVIRTDKAPKAIGPYSQAYKVNGMLFASGQIALDPVSGDVVGTDITSQTRQVLKNIEGILQASGMTFENVVKTTCFLYDMNDFAVFNKEYETAFVSKPARSCVAVKDLPKGVLVEIEMIAAE